MSIDLLPTVKQITVVQGDTFDGLTVVRKVNGVAVDITGFTASMYIRETEDRDSGLILGVSSPSDLTVDGPNGSVSFDVAASKMDLPVGRWWYDLQLTNGTKVYTLLRGPFVVEAEVTT
jgi:hypothetical protein